MEQQITEDSLGPSDNIAEHVLAHHGVSALLDGETGDKYKPTASPFHGTKDGEEAFKDIAKAAAITGKSIEQGVKRLFGDAKAIAVESKAQKDFHDAYEQSGILSSDPELLMDHLARQTAPISEHLPNLTVSLSKIGTDALHVLQQSKPSLIKSSPLDEDKTPSQNEIASFNDVAHLIDNPVSILNHIEKGTATIGHVKLLQQIYPNLLSRMQQSVMKHLIDYKAKEGTEIPHSTRLGLSRLLGQPVDSSVNYLIQNQAALAGISAQKQIQETQATQPSKNGISKMGIAQADQTKAQQSSERDRK